MAKTETANYTTERTKLQTWPIYFCQFRHLKTYGDGADYAFSRDFATGAVASPVKTKYPYLLVPSGSLQTVDHENGRSSIGTMTLRFVDVGGEFLKYISAPALTLKTAMTAGVPTDGGYVELNQDPGGLPAVGTIEITTAGAIERVRYDLVDIALDRVRVATSGRGADVTTAAVHNINDPITNGEQIRPGQRCQLYAGYSPLAEADYMAFSKMEVVRRAMLSDGVTYQVDLADIQRATRRAVFLGTTPAAPVLITGNPIDCALAVLLSTGGATSGAGTAGTTAGSNAVGGSGTSFTTFLAVGDAVALSGGEIFRVSSITSNTQFIATQNAVRGGSGQTYVKGGTDGRYDLLSALNGLAVPNALIDVSGLESLRSAEFPSDTFDFSLITPADGKSWIEEEIWKALNCYPRITQDGKYSAKRYRITGTPVKTLTRSDIIAWTWGLSDQGIINVVDFEYDWNLSSAKERFGKRQIYTHSGTGSSIQKYGRRSPMVIRSQGIKTAFGGQTLLDDRALQVIRRFSEPVTILTVDVLYQNHHLEVGDQVNITHSLIPNPDTGLRGITSQPFEILNLQPFFGREGKIRLTLLDPPPTAAAPSSGGVTTTPDVISDALVSTASIQAGAVTADGMDTQDGTFNFAGTTEETIASITITTAAGTVAILGKCWIPNFGPAGAVYRLRKDSITGTILDSHIVGAVINLVLVGRDSSPASGSQAYVFTGQPVSAGGNCSNRRLLATNLKK